ncbi:MAG: hypothetical protein AAFO95_03025 [Cyanobacteria bacterium J06600_6]
MKLKFIATFSLILNLVMLCSPTSCLAQERRRSQSATGVSNQYIGAGITTSGLAAYSKFALSDQFSLRPQILFDDLSEDFNGVVVVPLTYDFDSLGERIEPFVGIGGGSQTRNFDVGLEFTTGLDYSLSKRFTATGIFNIQLFDDNDINAIFGLGFNF